MNKKNSENKIMWSPTTEQIQQSLLTAFVKQFLPSVDAEDYAAIHQWSIDQPEQFWSAVWEFSGMIGNRNNDVVMQKNAASDPELPLVEWFPKATINYAENLLRYRDDNDAIVFNGENKVSRRLTHQQLYAEVAAFAAALRHAGIEQGDRVAAYMPNMPETIIAMLATASIGAVFTSASPDFGVQGVVDRFGQVEPKLMISCDGYWYNNKAIDVLSKLQAVAEKIPSIENIVVVDYLQASDADANATPSLKTIANAKSYQAFTEPFRDSKTIDFAQLPFNHPLFIMYSSGTTGLPKSIVHSAGGTLVQHVKEHVLHSNINANDRVFYFTTCGWMMWNWLVSSLASGATLLLYDGNPFVDDGNVLWDFVDKENATHFGTSAKYISACAKQGVQPKLTHQLDTLRVMLSTGSPLVPEDYDYVYAYIKSDLQLSSISGGTDIISCFVLGNPNLPVRRGEIQCKGLGLAVDVWNEASQSITEAKGELVCTQPFPCMPIGFWNDAEHAKYKATYFSRFTGIWCQGDFSEITENGGLIIYGRSDTTLNPGGVRIGTAEIYRQVEKLPDIIESIVVGQRWQDDVRVVLFVKLRENIKLNEDLIKKIKLTIKINASPRHVPACVIQVADIPRTKSGKIVEQAVSKIIHNETVKNKEALANPEALEYFRNCKELQCD